MPRARVVGTGIVKVRPDAPVANQHGYISTYVSPHGCLVGLRDRLQRWVDRCGRDRSLPWAGLGFINDLEAVVQLLNLREFAEHLRVNGTPEQQAFAADILADQETIEAVRMAVDTAGYRDEPDPVRAVEIMDDEARAVRKVLIDCGALASDDEETNVPDLVRALLS